ncbi:MAG TPA: hypothetical protein VGA70_05615 [Longimicrobiales bacterium]
MLHLHVSEPDDPALAGLGAALAGSTSLVWRLHRLSRRAAAGRVRHHGLRTLGLAPGPASPPPPVPGDTVLLTSPAQAPLLDTLCDHVSVAYYAKDNFAVGHGWAPERVRRWEAVITRRSEHVVAVSQSLAAELGIRNGLRADRVGVSPNAVPAAVIPERFPEQPRPLPGSLGAVPRPVAGVLGRVSSRLRLDWLRAVVDRTPWLHWLFAGDVEPRELRIRDLTHLAWLRRHFRCHFTGRRTYDELCAYAGAVDVAVLPYSDASVNPWASPMRLFLHLPFGRPILATPGCQQLEEFAPLVTLCRSPEDLAETLEELRWRDFDDGLGQARWQAAAEHTWERRAEGLIRRLPALPGCPA